jgi:hypothetical protein
MNDRSSIDAVQSYLVEVFNDLVDCGLTVAMPFVTVEFGLEGRPMEAVECFLEPNGEKSDAGAATAESSFAPSSGLSV